MAHGSSVNVATLAACMQPGVHSRDDLEGQCGRLAARLCGETDPFVVLHAMPAGGIYSMDFPNTLETCKRKGWSVRIAIMTMHDRCSAEEVGTRIQLEEGAIKTRQNLDDAGFEDAIIVRADVDDDEWLIDESSIELVMFSHDDDIGEINGVWFDPIGSLP